MKILNIFSRRNRILLSELVATDFKLRYQGSVLGYLWSVLKPLSMFGVLYLVFAVVLQIGKGIDHYPVYLLLGVILWNFFSETTNQGKAAIVSRGSLIRKISFPKYIIVVASSISALINLVINLCVVTLFAVINGVQITSLIIFLPLIILELYIFSLAVAFFLSAANVKFRDIGHLWEIFLQAAFYATPIIYPLNLVFEKSEFMASLMIVINPMAQIIQDARFVVVNQEQTLTLYRLLGQNAVVIVPFAIVIVVTVLASVYFRRQSKYFAEKI